MSPRPPPSFLHHAPEYHATNSPSSSSRQALSSSATCSHHRASSPSPRQQQRGAASSSSSSLIPELHQIERVAAFSADRDGAAARIDRVAIVDKMQGPLSQNFDEFLQCSCTGEFSGFVLKAGSILCFWILDGHFSERLVGIS